MQSKATNETTRKTVLTILIKFIRFLDKRKATEYSTQTINYHRLVIGTCQSLKSTHGVECIGPLRYDAVTAHQKEFHPILVEQYASQKPH